MKNKECYTKPFRCDEFSGWIYDKNEMHTLDVRGWGFLTGCGALNMPEDKAAKIRAAFKQHVVDALNAYKPFDQSEK